MLKTSIYVRPTLIDSIFIRGVMIIAIPDWLFFFLFWLLP